MQKGRRAGAHRPLTITITENAPHLTQRDAQAGCCLINTQNICSFLSGETDSLSGHHLVLSNFRLIDSSSILLRMQVVGRACHHFL